MMMPLLSRLPLKNTEGPQPGSSKLRRNDGSSAIAANYRQPAATCQAGNALCAGELTTSTRYEDQEAANCELFCTGHQAEPQTARESILHLRKGDRYRVRFTRSLRAIGCEKRPVENHVKSAASEA